MEPTDIILLLGQQIDIHALIVKSGKSNQHYSLPLRITRQLDDKPAD